MCLYPTLIINPKYKANKKNGGVIPLLTDNRIKYVPIGCNNCIECRKQKAKGWHVRLLEDVKHRRDGKFITLTFSNEEYAKLYEEIPIEIEGYARDNAIATLATRRFLERWRKEYGKSLRHWFITELGHNGTENIHIHGIVWTNKPIQQVANKWQYGYTWLGTKIQNTKRETVYINYVNANTATYITKYVTKLDAKHSHYKPIILTSPGIGGAYIGTHNADQNKYKEKETIETYRTTTGHKMTMPIYWRNKIYTDKQREQLWIYKLDKQERWIMGEKIDMRDKNAEKTVTEMLRWHRQRAIEIGYTDNTKTWDEEQYQKNIRTLKQLTRIQDARVSRATDARVSRATKLAA
jgi:hypothetical protein